MELPVFKIRCSAIGQIMGGALTKPTAKQLATIADLQSREKLTVKQQEMLDELIAKRDSQPQLQEGAKTYCQNWIKEHIYGRSKQFSSKYTDKGVECEQDALDLIARVQGYGFVTKNKVRKENDFMTGECDLLRLEIVEDAKCPWDCFTFPLFAEKMPEQDYFLQGQGYMKLYDRPKFAVNYCLMDAPEHIVDQQVKIEARKQGMFNYEADFYDYIKSTMTYSHLPDHLRVKRFEFNRDDTVIAAIEQQVVLCRQYIAEIYEPIKRLLTPQLKAA